MANKIFKKTVITLSGIGLCLTAVWHGLGKHLEKYTSKPVRIDKEGKLYFIDYFGDFYDCWLVCLLKYFLC